MSSKKSTTTATVHQNASNDAAKHAHQSALAAKKAEFAARLKQAKAARSSARTGRRAASDNSDNEEDEEEDEADDEEDESEEELSHQTRRHTQPRQKKESTTNRSNAVQQRGPKLQKRTEDEDTSTAVEVGTSDGSTVKQPTTTESIKSKLELGHYFFPTESGEWKLSPIEFERYGLKSPISSMNDQSVNDALMFPVLPPVWKRDQLYVPESFKNEQSRVPLEERTNKIMYDVDQPSRPHRRMVLPQIYPNAIQTEQLNLLANRESILEELSKTAALTAGREDPSIRSLFGPSAAIQTNATVDDIEMKDAPQSSSSSSLTTSTVDVEVDIEAASKSYVLDFSLASANEQFAPWRFHFHAQPLVCERERKKSDEYFFNDLLLAKQVQEKVMELMKSIHDMESKMVDKDESQTSATTLRLLPYSKIYRALQASPKPNWDAIMTSIPIGDFALFLAWFVSDSSSHDLASRQFACEVLVRLLLSPKLGVKMKDKVEEKEEAEEGNDGDSDESEEEDEDEDEEEAKGENDEDEDDEEEEEEEEDVEDDANRDALRPQLEKLAAGGGTGGGFVNDATVVGPTKTKLNLDPIDICVDRLKLFKSCNQNSKQGRHILRLKQQTKTQIQYSQLIAHEVDAIKGLLSQFALKKTDEILLASITQVLGLISAVEDFSGSWLTYIQALAFSAGTYDQPIRTGVTLPPPSELSDFSTLGHTALNYSTTYPLPQPYVCFSILFDLSDHHYMFSRNHFATTNGVFDLIQSIIGATLIQRIWQPNEESHILNAVLECSRSSGQAPAINLDGYLTYAIMDLFHRSHVSGDYSRLMEGCLTLSTVMCLDLWNGSVYPEGNELELEDSQPDVFTAESIHWMAPFIRLIFEQRVESESVKRQLTEWQRTQWRRLFSGDNQEDRVKESWSLWWKVINSVCLFNPVKSFDVEANLLDLASLVLPLLESTSRSQWYAMNGSNQVKWLDYDLKSKSGLSKASSQFLTKWLVDGCGGANMNGNEEGSSRRRHYIILKTIRACWRLYQCRLKHEAENEMVWWDARGKGVPTCLKSPETEKPSVVPTGQHQPELTKIDQVPTGQHQPELTKIDQVLWTYLAETAVRIGLIKVDQTAPLGYVYVDPDLEYDPQQHRDLSPENNLLLESISSRLGKSDTSLEPYLKFLRLVVVKWLAESVHLSMRLQALVHLKKRWKELLPLVGEDVDYTAKVELVKCYGVEELNVPNVLLDIITDYAFPCRSIHYSYMRFLGECVQSTFYFVHLYGCNILKAMYDSCEVVSDSFSQYYFSILFEGLELGAHRMKSMDVTDLIQLESDKLTGQVIHLLQSTLSPPDSSQVPSTTHTFSPTFLIPFYERLQLIELNHVESLAKELQELNQLMKQIVEPKEKEMDVSAPAPNFNFSFLTTDRAVTDPNQPFVFNLGQPTTISPPTTGYDSSLSSSTPGAFVFNLAAPVAATTPFGGFSMASLTGVFAPAPPTPSIESINSVLDYLVAHSSDYAAVHQYHNDFDQEKMKYDPQIWFRTLQPLLKLLDNGNDITQLITILAQLLEGLEAKDTLTILHALSPFIALFSKRINIPTASSTAFMFHFTLPYTASASAISSTTTAAPLNFNFGTTQPSTLAPPTTDSLTSSGDQGIDRISIDPNPPEQQLHAIIRSLVNSLFRVLQSPEEAMDVVIGNLVSTHINQLLQAPSLIRGDIEKWVREWVASCSPHSFQIEEDDYLRSLPSSDSHSLGGWCLPPIKLRFRFLLHLRHNTCLDIVDWSDSRSVVSDLIDYFQQYLVTPATPPLSRESCFFLMSLIRPSKPTARAEPITFLKSIAHLIQPLTLKPSVEWTNTDDLFGDELIQFIERSIVQNEEVFPYKPHERSEQMMLGRFFFQYLVRLGYRSRSYLEDRARKLDNHYQQPAQKSTVTIGGVASVGSTQVAANVSTTPPISLNLNFGSRATAVGNEVLHSLHPAHPLTLQKIPSGLVNHGVMKPRCLLCHRLKSDMCYQCLHCSSGPILCETCCTFTPKPLMEKGFQLFWKSMSAANVTQFVGIFSIIHPFMQYDPDRETLADNFVTNRITPSLNTAVRGLASHPDRTLFYHAPRKGIRYTCLTCTKSYASTSSYYDPCDDSHWCFNCIEWTNELITSVRSREEFDRIYQLQVKEFHDQQLLTKRPPPSNTPTHVSIKQLKLAGDVSSKPNQMGSPVFKNIIGAVNHLFDIQINSTEYHGLLTDLSLTPNEFNELKAAHINDLQGCLERDLGIASSDHLPVLPSWQQTGRLLALLLLFSKQCYEFPQLLPLVTQAITRGLESEFVIIRMWSLMLISISDDGVQDAPKKVLRSIMACRQESSSPSITHSLADTAQSIDPCMTVGERFEYALLHTVGCSNPILRAIARTLFAQRAETMPTLLLMNYINNKFEVEDDNEILQPETLTPLTYHLRTKPFVYAFLRDNFDSKVIKFTGPIYSITRALSSPVINPQLREARAGLGRLIQLKWLSLLTFVQKVNGHQSICSYAKLVQEGINSSGPRTPPIPKAAIQFLAKLILNSSLEDELTGLYSWIRTFTERCTAESVLFSQLDSEDVNTALHDTPLLRSTLEAMITLYTILPFLPCHLVTIKRHLPLVSNSAFRQLKETIIELARTFEGMLRRCMKSSILRRLVIQPYEHLWITCCVLRSYYLLPHLGQATEVPPSRFDHDFLDRLKYSDEEEFDVESVMSPHSPGCVVLLTELLMYPSTVNGDRIDSVSLSVQACDTITTGLCWLFDGVYEYAIQLVQVVPPSEGRLELPNLNELFTRIRGWMLHHLPEASLSPSPQPGDTTIPCVFIDTLALMIQTAVQLPLHSQQSIQSPTARSENNSALELLSYRLVELLPVVLATFHLYATTSLADLDGQCQPLLVSMRQYLRVIHQQLNKEKQLSSHTSTRAPAVRGSSSVNRLGMIVQLYLPLMLHFYRVTYMDVINRNKWDDPVDDLNLTKKRWSWTIDVPEAQFLNEVSHLPS